jgi:hypothetical protein
MKALVGERRAIAAAVLSFYGFIYLLLGFSAPPEWSPALTAIAALYAVAFFGVVAGWFWGRWYAQGIGYWGLVSGVLGMWQIGPEPVLVFLTASHAVLALLLAGEAMAAGFDGRPDWRTRFHLDNRLGKSVVRAAMSLPILLMWALAPTQPNHLEALVPLALGGAGVWALLRMRTWGLFALGGSAVVLAGQASSHASVAPLAVVAAALLGAAVIPFVGPMVKHLRTA